MENDNCPQQITFSDFLKLHIVVGTILSAELNPKAKKPAYLLKIDFGHFGIKISSAQITQNYSIHQLLGEQIIAVINFPAKKIAGVTSEVLVLAAVCDEKGTVLLQPKSSVENGTQIL